MLESIERDKVSLLVTEAIFLMICLRKSRNGEKRRYESGKRTCGKGETVKAAGMEAGSVPAEKPRR